MNFDSDDLLIHAVRRRDPRAWADVYERLADEVFGFLRNQSIGRQEAEDLTATTFLRAIKAAPRFKGTFSDLRAWIFRIARNNLIDFHRKNRRTSAESWEVVSEGRDAEASDDTAGEAIFRVEVDRIRKAIERLTPDQKQVLLLRLNAGLSSPEIAKILGKTPGAVKALVHRGISSLARELGSNFVEEGSE